MVVTTAHIVLASVGALVFVGIFTIMGIYLYLGYTRMEEILSHVKNCKSITKSRFYLDLGPWGRLVMVGIVAGFLALPDLYIKNGSLDADDIKNFPEPLKRRLALSHYIVWGLGLCMFISAIGMKFLDGAA